MPEKDKLEKNKEILKRSASIIRNSAIYRNKARGNYDTEGFKDPPTWCIQASLDQLEETGVHTEATYGKKGTRRTGYDVTANQACRNIEKYRDKWAISYACKELKAKGKSIYEYSPKDFENIQDEYKKEYEEGLKECPIQEISAKEAQQLANKGYTTFAVEYRLGHGHIAIVLPDSNPYKAKNGPLLSNVGFNVGIMYAKDIKAFGPNSNPKYYYDREQSFEPNAGFEEFGIAYDNKTKKQSISIHDPRYNEADYEYYDLRKERVNKFAWDVVMKREEEKIFNMKLDYLDLLGSTDFSTKDKKKFNSLSFMGDVFGSYLNLNLKQVGVIDEMKPVKDFCKAHDITLAGEIAKNGDKLSDVLTGKGSLGEYLDERLTEQKEVEERAKAEAKAAEEARKKAEQAAAEKATQEAEEKEKEVNHTSEDNDPDSNNETPEPWSGNNNNTNNKYGTSGNSGNHQDNNSQGGNTGNSNGNIGNGGTQKPKPGSGTTTPNKPGNGGGTGGNNGATPKPDDPPSGGGGGRDGEHENIDIGSHGVYRLSTNTENPGLGEYYIDRIRSNPLSGGTKPIGYYTEQRNNIASLQNTVNIGFAGSTSNDISIKEDEGVSTGNEWV